MDLWDETERNLVELNAELSRSGESARVRYMVIQPDPDWDGEWMVTTVWELPPPDPGREVWPHHKLMDYEQMLADRLVGVASTSCLFRTAKTVAKAFRNARAVPESADKVPESR